MVQPNVVTPDRKAGVQTGEMMVIRESGIERLHTHPARLPGYLSCSAIQSALGERQR